MEAGEAAGALLFVVAVAAAVAAAVATGAVNFTYPATGKPPSNSMTFTCLLIAHRRSMFRLGSTSRLLRRAVTLLLRWWRAVGRVARGVGVGAVRRGGAGAAGGGVGVHVDVGDAGGGGHLQLRRQHWSQAPGMEARAPVQVGAPRRRRRRGEGGCCCCLPHGHGPDTHVQ